MDARSTTRFARIALIALALSLGLGNASRSALAAVSYGIGTDYSSGPGKQSVRDAMGYLQSAWRRTDLTLAIARFNSSQVGVGTNVALAGTWVASPRLSFQAMASRAAGEFGYHGSRLQAGPVFPFHGGTWGALLTHAEDTVNPATTGLSTEAALPLSPVVIALGRGSLAAVQGGGTNLQAAAGFIWGASKRLLVISELALGRDATGLVAGAPGESGIPITGRVPGVARDYLSGPSVTLGVRYVIR